MRKQAYIKNMGGVTLANPLLVEWFELAKGINYTESTALINRTDANRPVVWLIQKAKYHGATLFYSLVRGELNMNLLWESKGTLKMVWGNVCELNESDIVEAIRKTDTQVGDMAILKHIQKGKELCNQ